MLKRFQCSLVHQDGPSLIYVSGDGRVIVNYTPENYVSVVPERIEVNYDEDRDLVVVDTHGYL